MKAGVIVFPGSNCERDCEYAMRAAMGWDTTLVWHGNRLPRGLDLVVLPGGFSHGDYLRAGALAALSPIIDDVRAFAQRGGLVLGICNGFQILCETDLLPGTLIVNRDLHFHCEDVWLKTEHTDSAFTSACPPLMRIPIAHKEGSYRAAPDVLRAMEDEGRVLFRYSNAAGEVSDATNPNGSLNNIAGIINDRGNVCGMMPHPERVCDAMLGGTDGRFIFDSIAMALTATGGKA